MPAYYNEFDPYAAQWLRNLIAEGLIAPGDVDERSIVDVQTDDLRGYEQCHFFAGIGGWSFALRLAGWDDTRPVWTGSCPCQPFSSAGRQEGHGDERHLWPHWARLIRESKPPIVFGEQVAGAITFGWLDEVFNDLEAEAYSCASAILPACSVGKPHRRDRLWFVANSNVSQRETERLPRGISSEHDRVGEHSSNVADANISEQGGRPREAGREGKEIRFWGGMDTSNANLNVANTPSIRQQGQGGGWTIPQFNGGLRWESK